MCRKDDSPSHQNSRFITSKRVKSKILMVKKSHKRFIADYILDFNYYIINVTPSLQLLQMVVFFKKLDYNLREKR